MANGADACTSVAADKDALAANYTATADNSYDRATANASSRTNRTAAAVAAPNFTAAQILFALDSQLWRRSSRHAFFERSRLHVDSMWRLAGFLAEAVCFRQTAGGRIGVCDTFCRAIWKGERAKRVASVVDS